MYNDLSVSLVIPCYNEEEGLNKLLESVPRFIDEVIVVNNGSTDHTARVAQRYGAVVVDEPVRGYGQAYVTGLPRARGDIIVTMDGDRTYPVEEVESIIDFMLKENYRFVSGCRFPLKDKSSMPLLSRVANGFISYIFRSKLKIKMKDFQTGMWIFKREILTQILPDNIQMGFSQEIKLKAWLNKRIRATEYHISYHPRIGRSKFRRLKDGYKCLIDAMHFIHLIKEGKIKGIEKK